MKQTKLIMGMPITIEIRDQKVTEAFLKKIFHYFRHVDRQFSPFKLQSEVSNINNGSLTRKDYSSEMREILALAEQTQRETDGYFSVWHDGKFDPSGIVKGWAIEKAARLIEQAGFCNFYIEAGGDIHTRGTNEVATPWRVGIRNPFAPAEVVKIVLLRDHAIATSGNYVRGEHIYNPHGKPLTNDIVSMSVIAPTIIDADRFATAAFAMGRSGIYFLEQLPGVAGYMIDAQGQATYTSRFKHYEIS